jgi:hypothetical protein
MLFWEGWLRGGFPSFRRSNRVISNGRAKFLESFLYLLLRHFLISRQILDLKCCLLGCFVFGYSKVVGVWHVSCREVCLLCGQTSFFPPSSLRLTQMERSRVGECSSSQFVLSISDRLKECRSSIFSLSSEVIPDFF